MYAREVNHPGFRERLFMARALERAGGSIPDDFMAGVTRYLDRHGGA
jgi:hypothetical protein